LNPDAINRPPIKAAVATRPILMRADFDIGFPEKV